MFHPYFVGVTEVEIKPNTKSVEVACKLFTDDIQSAVLHSTGKRFNAFQNDSQQLKILATYFLSHLKIFANDQHSKYFVIPLNLIGFEIQGESVWMYAEGQSEILKDTKKVKVFNSMIYKEHPEQIHIVHFKQGTLKKSGQLRNPESQIEFEN